LSALRDMQGEVRTLSSLTSEVPCWYGDYMSVIHVLATAPQGAQTRQLLAAARTIRQPQPGLTSPQCSAIISRGPDPNFQTLHPPLRASKCRGVSTLRDPEVAAVGLLTDRKGRVGGMSVSTGNPAGGFRPRLALEHDIISCQPIVQSPSPPICRQTTQHTMNVRP